jgi:hypothetical protein
MKHWALAVAAVATVAAAVFAALYFTKASTTSAAAAPCGEQRLFGHVSALARKNGHLELRFDPALLTTGVTANTAAAEDGAVPPGQPVPNDSYVIDESHRLLTYKVDPAARVTVLTRNGPGPLGETPIGLTELEHIVNGGPHRALFEPLDSGVWIKVHVDNVCSLDQQYRP